MPESVGQEILAMKRAAEALPLVERKDCPVCGWTLEKKEGQSHCKFCGWLSK